MSEFGGFDVDLEAARAWSRFQTRLGDHLVAMADDDVLVLEVDSGTDYAEGCAPYAQLTAAEGAAIRAEIASNAYLAPERRLDEASEEYLRTLGFAAPDTSVPDAEGTPSRNFVLDAERADGRRLAVVTVSALRRVFGVPHPVFLSASQLGEGDVEPDLGIPVPVREDAPTVQLPDAVTPDDSEHLRELVSGALAPLFGNVPATDEDGDIPVPHGSALVFVRVLDDQPVIELFAFVVHGVVDRGAAEVEVSILNRDHRFIKFVVAEDSVVAVVQLPAHPFVPAHLRALLPMVARTLDGLDDDLARRTGGHRSLEPGRDHGRAVRPPSALPRDHDPAPGPAGASGEPGAPGAPGAPGDDPVDLEGLDQPGGDGELPGLTDEAVDRLLDDLTGPAPDLADSGSTSSSVPRQPGEPDVPPGPLSTGGRSRPPGAAGSAHGGVPPQPGQPTPGVDGEGAAQEHSERVAGGLHPVLQRLVEEPAGRPGLTDDELVELCGRDAQMLLRFLRTSGQQELDWRRFRDQAMLLGDVEEAAACDGEMGAWERTTQRLRAALAVLERERRTPGLRFDPQERPRRSRRWRPPGPRRRPHGPDSTDGPEGPDSPDG